MVKYRFKNTIIPPCPEPMLGELFGDPEFECVHWFGDGLSLSACAISLEPELVYQLDLV